MYLGYDDSTSDTSPTSVHQRSPQPMEVERALNELGWKDFVESLSDGFLPHDGEQRTPFDQTLHFEVGDPHATGGGLPRVYDKSNEEGGPSWLLLFKYLLQQCRHIQHYDTVHLLVDTRDLTKVDNVEPGLVGSAMLGLEMSKLIWCLLARPGTLACILSIRPGLARLYWLHWSSSSPRRTLFSWTVIACQ